MKPNTLLTLLIMVVLPSCTVTINPDGSKSGTLDGEAVIRIINSK